MGQCHDSAWRFSTGGLLAMIVSRDVASNIGTACARESWTFFVLSFPSFIYSVFEYCMWISECNEV